MHKVNFFSQLIAGSNIFVIINYDKIVTVETDRLMKLLVLKPCLIARSNGGEISLLERLRIFKSWGIDIQIRLALPSRSYSSPIAILDSFGTPLIDNAYEVDGLRCDVHFDKRFNPDQTFSFAALKEYFVSVLKSENPDLVWVHYTDFAATAAALTWNPKKVWVNITDNEFPRQVDLNQFPILEGTYLQINSVTVASSFMQKSVRADIPWAESLLLPSPLESLSEPPLDRKPTSWVFVNPVPVKGVHFAVELAKRLPSEKFIFVGNWMCSPPETLPPNVTFVPRQKNLLSIFSEAKGILIPSFWDEAFGRIAIEAMAANVPVIGSDRGALPETIGSGGLSLPLDIDRWVKVMNSPSSYFKELSIRGLRRAKQYQNDRDIFYRALYLTLSQQIGFKIDQLPKTKSFETFIDKDSIRF
ncbi:MAG: hypothetical protein JWQ35_144 [Bacteriovoracaceae bacterium]|nr:hypothetical protein [Bacteriovoracaceae bacterium]